MCFSAQNPHDNLSSAVISGMSSLSQDTLTEVADVAMTIMLITMAVMHKNINIMILLCI